MDSSKNGKVDYSIQEFQKGKGQNINNSECINLDLKPNHDKNAA